MNPNNKIPNVMELLPRFVEYVKLKDNAVGGSLHIWLSDSNIEDHNMEFCIENAIERGDSEGEALARLGLEMSKTQRSKIIPLIWNEADKSNFWW